MKPRARKASELSCEHDSLWDFSEIYESLDKLSTKTKDASIQKNIEDAKRSFGMLRAANQEALKLKGMLSDGEIWDFADMPPVSGLAVLYLTAIMDKESIQQARSKLGAHAVNARHDKPGGSRELAARIRMVWATGKYTSRDICAEEEWAELGFKSFSTARKALRNTPDNA
ncbi:hypothetical protein [Stutzerimonas kunmingensis]|uniref:hypothetical protein n=1 Tax=Stutzerimonas kunmingensis TaxID=1211807 RepID=UPI0028ADB960|nr:hypothetical protein [Stutzerimonas kunmingensis]